MLASRLGTVLDHFDTWWRKAIFLFFVAAFSAAVTLALLSVSRQIGGPSPGFLVWDNLVVPALGASDSAAAASLPYRSVLTEMNGERLRDADDLRGRIGSLPARTSVVYTFEHEGRTVRLAVPTTALRWRDMAPVFLPYLLIGISFFVTGLVVFYLRPSLPAAHAALMLGVTLGGTLVLAIDTLSSFWVQRLYFMLESLIPAALLHFALVFPEEKVMVRRHPGVKALVYLPFAALGVMQNLYLRSAPAAHLAVNDWVYTAIGAAGLAAISSLLYSFATSADPVARQQAKVVAAGGALAAFVPSLGLLAVTVAGMEVPINFLAPFFLIFPLSIAYAIARHDLFQVDRFLRLGVVYAAMTLFFFAGYAALVVGMEHWSGAEHRLPEGAVPLYLLGVLLLLDPLRSRTQRLVDRLFYRQAYNYRATVETTSRALAAILDTDRIASVVLETLTDVMAIEWGAICVLADSLTEVHTYARPAEMRQALDERLRRNPEALATAVRRRRLWTRYETPWRPEEVEDHERLTAFGAALLLPAYFEGEPMALVALGERRSGAFYSSEDLDLIQTLVNQAALALENARAYEIIRRTQQELVRAEKLAAVGELSAAVAHGIRNPLAGIRAAAQVAREEPDDVETVRENLNDIIGEADRLEHRVRTLLDFARPFEPTLVTAQLNALVGRFAEDIRKRVPPGVELSIDLDPALPPVSFDSVQMTEILEALVVNAMEAMGGNGRLRIRTLFREGAERGAVLTVNDSGPGIDEAQQKKIFDLFYTTKSSGTGIGLATVKRLVDRHRGEISVASTPGAGTTFEICLPVALALTTHTA